jgi:hypothetical protein
MGFYSIIDCEELHGTKSEDGDDKGFNASVVLRCLWDFRFSLAVDLIDTPRTWPDNPYAVARKVGITPHGGEYVGVGQSCEYKYADVSVQYSTNPDEDILTESIEPTSEFRTLDHRLFRWGSGSGALLNENQAPGQIIRGFNLIRSFKTPLVPTSILTKPGTCNLTTYTSSLLGLTFAAETLMFGMQPITRVIKMSGSTAFNLTVKFTYKDSGWNKFWNESAGAYQNIYLVGSGTPYKPYTPSSFSEYLF